MLGISEGIRGGRAVARIGLAGLALAATCATPAQELPGPADLWDRATLYRDEWGVPHVYAEDPFAMAFAFGYAQAEDHAQAMLAAYRVANGSAAEVFGEFFSASDEFALKMGHAMLARIAGNLAGRVGCQASDGIPGDVSSERGRGEDEQRYQPH